MTVIVTMAHIRKAGLCSGGAREWFASHNLPWGEFLAHGMSAERLEATGDALAIKVTAIARAEVADGRRG